MKITTPCPVFPGLSSINTPLQQTRLRKPSNSTKERTTTRQCKTGPIYGSVVLFAAWAGLTWRAAHLIKQKLVFRNYLTIFAFLN